ncbi:MAG TPA: tyrosine-type recombinase/integrase [Blastocatellia bacterium]|nr:tyrosine-type recombinase/integrase [Blastocatellia bacterium]
MKGELKQIGEDKFFIRIFLGRDAKGKRSWHSETFNGKKRMAENRRSELVSLHGQGELVKRQRISFIDYLESLLSGPVKETIARRTYSDYQSMVARYVRPHKVACIKLTDLSPDHLESLYKDMRARNLSASTVRYLHNILKRALKQAERRGKVHRNVASLVELPKQKRRKIPRSLDFDQASKFLTEASCDRFFALWILALDSGARPEEYLALEWSDVDFAARTLRINKALCWNRKGGGYYFDDTKTEASNRTVEIAPTTIEALKEHKRVQAESRMRAGKTWAKVTHDSRQLDLVFTTHMGTPLLLSNLHRRSFKPILRRAGLPLSFRIYDLRHTCATLLGAMNVRAKLIQERLGHSSIKTTLDLYSHVLQSERHVASGAFEETVFARLKV